MEKITSLALIILLALACNGAQKSVSIAPVNWSGRKMNLPASDSLLHHSTYLSVYSEIYHIGEGKTFNLTVTVSMRNISSTDTVYIERADYFDTHGALIRTYFDYPIYISPLETLEIVIDESAGKGGTGGNFIFDWAIKDGSNEPLFDAVMISTSGQQGLSFTSQGVKR